MAHLQLVRTNGREVAPRPPVPRGQDRVLHLPRLDMPSYSAMLASEDEGDVLMRRDARVDARRFVRNLRARHPIADAEGLCVWNLVGDLLCHLVPLAPSAQDLEDAAHALRLVVRLVIDGEALGAGMLVGGVLLSIHGEGRDGLVEITLGEGDVAIGMRFRIEDGSFLRIP